MILSWIGLFLGISGIIAGQLLEGGNLAQLFQPTAALIVFGGTLGATLLSTTMREFAQAIQSSPKVFFHSHKDFGPLIRQMIGIAIAARKEGILGLEIFLGRIENGFFSTHLRHLIDGYDPNILRSMMEERIAHEEEEKTAVAKVWETAGGYSPTIGILGAVLGLIHVMSVGLTDSSRLGTGIAVAFVATIYGVGAANLILIPIASKLRKIAKEEILELQLIYVGLLGIQSGLNPRVIEDRLNNLRGEYARHAPKSHSAILEKATPRHAAF